MDDRSLKILDAAHQAEILGYFKAFCDMFYNDSESKKKFRNIIFRSSDKNKTIAGIFRNYLKIELDEDDLPYMLELVEAFLNKKSYREKIESRERVKLIQTQNGKCPFCGCDINEHDPVDHIVPFKYVGDELKDNYQVLCCNCNSRKRESIDFQIKVLLNL